MTRYGDLYEIVADQVITPEHVIRPINKVNDLGVGLRMMEHSFTSDISTREYGPILTQSTEPEEALESLLTALRMSIERFIKTIGDTKSPYLFFDFASELLNCPASRMATSGEEVRISFSASVFVGEDGGCAGTDYMDIAVSTYS